MSENRTTLQQHNSRLSENNVDLSSILEKINKLPVAGGVAPTVEKHYLEGTNVIIIFTDGTELVVDISEYIGDNGLTSEQVEAINDMNIKIENNELIFNYDEEVLDFDFSLNGNDLTVENNMKSTDFNINQNEELEVSY